MKPFYKQVFYALAALCLLAGPAAYAQQYDNGQLQYNNNQQYNDQGSYQGDQQQGDNGSVTVQTFYDDLQPYGQWVDDQQYGYVFVPNVEQTFRPYYTDGHWAMTDYGNTWVSDYPWGWACFHYGRWTYDNYYGWVWVPGTDWGPAWVNWRYGTGYYGWAPLSPDYSIGIGASFGDYNCPDDWWVFIPPQYIYSPNYYHYWGGPGENAGIIHNTHLIRNTFANGHTTYITGPRASEIEGITHQPVTTYQLANSTKPTKSRVKGNTVKLYHPAVVNQAGNGGGRPAPQNIVRAPQPIGKPQAATGNTEAPAFRGEMRNSTPSYVTPRQQNMQQSTPQRYEWDVNKSQPQQAQPPRNQEPAERPQPQQQQAPRQQQQAPRPQQQQAPRPQPQPAYHPQPQMSHSAPAQHFSAPSGGGGRR